MCEVNAHFPGRFALIVLANRVQFNVWGIERENVHELCIAVSLKGIG